MILILACVFLFLAKRGISQPIIFLSSLPGVLVNAVLVLLIHIFLKTNPKKFWGDIYALLTFIIFPVYRSCTMAALGIAIASYIWKFFGFQEFPAVISQPLWLTIINSVLFAGICEVTKRTDLFRKVMLDMTHPETHPTDKTENEGKSE
jgi:hypothetical protein